MVLWLIAFLLFLILLRLWPELRSGITMLLGSTVILAVVLACLGGVAAFMYYGAKAAEHPSTVPWYGWLLISVVVGFGAWQGYKEKREKKRLLRSYHDDASALTDEQRGHAEQIWAARERSRRQFARILPLVVGLSGGGAVFILLIDRFGALLGLLLGLVSGAVWPTRPGSACDWRGRNSRAAGPRPGR
ncbi:MAG TPA: hypothetical protein VMT20_01945 [Terriglobia bacterium]|nr:hypothetical protein [Terriglobia bacterium]